jgi:hypothetical protein
MARLTRRRRGRGTILVAALLAGCGNKTTSVVPLNPAPSGVYPPAPQPTQDGGVVASVPDGGAPARTGVCTVDGWCWTQPAPFAIGAGGITGLWGSSANDLWAVGGDMIAHFDGTTWTGELGVPTVSAIGGSSASDVWAVGAGGMVLHRTTAAWAQVASGTTQALRGVWGQGPKSAWFVGDGGTILRYDGTSLSASSSGTSEPLSAVWGAADNDVYVTGGGNQRTILHWDGAKWSKSVIGTYNVGFTGLWGSAANDVYAAGGTLFHFDGQGWSIVNNAPDATAVFGTAKDDVWIAGANGVQHWDGKAWTKKLPDNSTGWVLWASSLTNVWTAGAGLRHFDGTAFLTMIDPQPHDIAALAAITPTDAWAVSNGATTAVNSVILHFTAGVWTSTYTQKRTTVGLQGVWAAAANEAWAVGEAGTLARYNGAAWQVTPPPTTQTLHAVFGTAANDVWTVGDGGVALHFDGAKWSAVPTGESLPLLALFAAAGNDVWAAGGSNTSGALVHWDGAAWKASATPFAGALRSIWGAAANDVWLVMDPTGKTPTSSLYHWDGANWTEKPTAEVFSAVRGTAANDVYAVGGPIDQSRIMHYDGTSWSAPAMLGNAPRLTAIATAPGAVFVGATSGVLAK